MGFPMLPMPVVKAFAIEARAFVRVAWLWVWLESCPSRSELGGGISARSAGCIIPVLWQLC